MSAPQRRVAGVRRRTAPTLTDRSWKRPPSEHQLQGMASDVVLDMGWGRLVLGQTFADLTGILAVLRAEESGRRDICIYPRDPHVLVGLAPDAAAPRRPVGAPRSRQLPCDCSQSSSRPSCHSLLPFSGVSSPFGPPSSPCT